MKTVRLVMLCLITLIIGACSGSGSQIASFEDLTTEASKEGFTKLPQYRVISIPGLLPFLQVGGVHFYKPQRKPSSAIGLSFGEKSYTVQTTIEPTRLTADGSENGCDAGCLVEIRNKILAVKETAARLIEERVNLTRLATDPGSSGAVPSSRSSYQQLRQKLDQKHRDAVAAIQHRGVMVFRWNTNTRQQGSLGLGGLFGASGSSDETQSGFGLLSGLRTTTVYLGNDILATWGGLNGDSKFTNRLELTSYTLQARHILYMSENDLSRSLGAKLEASYDQLTNLDETLKTLDKIEINAALAKVSNLANIGVIGGAKSEKIPIDWQKLANGDDLTGQHDWQTIYAVKSDLSEILKMMRQLKQPAVNP
ncbi:hypothetical protein [Motiliproteus coralliicola]|nr:hypothetical protein [Motiliproteus coralliicola]